MSNSNENEPANFSNYRIGHITVEMCATFLKQRQIALETGDIADLIKLDMILTRYSKFNALQADLSDEDSEDI